MLLGDVASARDRLDLALVRAEELAIPYQRLSALVYGAAQSAWARDWAKTVSLATKGLEIAEDLGVQNYSSLARVLIEQARLAESPEAEIDGLEKAVRERTGLEERWWNSLFYGWLAEAHRRQGNPAAAEVFLDEASKVDEFEFGAELSRIRGELRLAQAAEGSDAERCFREAMAIADAQGAKLFELRAAVALGRLLVDRGRGDEAGRILRPLLRWFDQVEDLADVMDARQLVAGLPPASEASTDPPGTPGPA